MPITWIGYLAALRLPWARAGIAWLAFASLVFYGYWNPAFLPILAKARFVVTDSGGLQEECAHLGIPCAVHRARTERPNGEGQKMVLTGFSTDKVRQFLDDYERYRGGAGVDQFHPSRVIADTIENLGRSR